ncbi:MAG: hypothetical protein GY820_34735, partial [Gammaproteobacteria bacterium]|nr:hypothetical protein [Gammaproteobacteria bacterium]
FQGARRSLGRRRAAADCRRPVGRPKSGPDLAQKGPPSGLDHAGQLGTEADRPAQTAGRPAEESGQGQVGLAFVGGRRRLQQRADGGGGAGGFGQSFRRSGRRAADGGEKGQRRRRGRTTSPVVQEPPGEIRAERAQLRWGPGV